MASICARNVSILVQWLLTRKTGRKRNNDLKTGFLERFYTKTLYRNMIYQLIRMAKKVSEIAKAKTGTVLRPLEKRLTDILVPKIPRWLSTKKLTLLTLPWSILVLVFFHLAKRNIHWLWLVSLMIFFQYLSDLLDGAVGRARNEGFIKWGFYMDHMLDWIFVCSVLIGYSFILPGKYDYVLFFILGILGGFMAHSHLYYATARKFRISYFGIGGTELRFLLIVLNTLLIVFGKTYLGGMLPYVLGGTTIALFIVIYRAQKELHNLDKRNRKKYK